MRHMMCRPSRQVSRPSSFDSLFNEFFAPGSPQCRETAFLPKTDVLEKPDRFEITIDLPGMKKEDIRIVIEEGILTVSGERKKEGKAETDRYSRTERSGGSFKRSFRLPENVESDTVEAAYESGVLILTVKKVEETPPRQIEVKVN